MADSLVYDSEAAIGAHMSLHNHSGDTIATSTGQKIIGGYDAEIWSHAVTVDKSAGTLTILVDGVYSIGCTLSFSGDNGDSFHIHIAVDGSDTQSGLFRTMLTTQKGSGATHARRFLSAGQVVSITAEEEGDTRDMTLYYCDFGLDRIG